MHAGSRQSCIDEPLRCSGIAGTQRKGCQAAEGRGVNRFASKSFAPSRLRSVDVAARREQRPLFGEKHRIAPELDECRL